MENDNAKFPEWFVTLMQDVLDMRDAQQDYFAQRSDYRLKVSMGKEARVDAHLKGYVKRGVIKHSLKPKIVTNELFKQ